MMRSAVFFNRHWHRSDMQGRARGALGSFDPWLRSYPYHRISVMAASGMRAPLWCSLQVSS